MTKHKFKNNTELLQWWDAECSSLKHISVDDGLFVLQRSMVEGMLREAFSFGWTAHKKLLTRQSKKAENEL